MDMKNGAQQHVRSSRGEQSRTLILSTAFDVFSEIGPGATTLRHLSRQAGVNIATLMYYFPSKEALVAEVIQLQEVSELDVIKKWHASLTDRQLSQMDLLKDALTELGTMVIDRVIADPARFRLWVYTALQTSKKEGTVRRGSSALGVETRPLETGPAAARHLRSPERNVVRAVLVRAMELDTFHCDRQELDDYIDGFTYLSRGFALDHIQEIALGTENRNRIIRRFKKLISRYVHHMLPGEKD